MDLNSLWTNLLSYFQNTPLKRQGNGVASADTNQIPQGSAQDYMPDPAQKPVVELQQNWSNYQDKPSFPPEYVSNVDDASKQYNIPIEILMSQIAQETGGYNYQPVRGASGERGITQIIPDFWYQNAGYGTPDEYGNKLETDKLFAMMEAARILRSLMGEGNDYAGGLSQYNSGSPDSSQGLKYAQEILQRVGR
jgi:hypothetical protein